MTPTLRGRMETRVVLVATVGVVMSIAWFPLLWLGADGFGSQILALGVGLGLLMVPGLLWELLYHAGQQLRWDRDWPLLLAVVAGIPELLLATWIATKVGTSPFNLAEAAIHLGSVRVASVVLSAGPLRVLVPQLRYRGGRLV